MKQLKVVCVFGTRPEIIKLAPVIRAFGVVEDKVVLVHTGQHYDQMLSGVFFNDLSVPKPDYNLGVGSGTRVFQITEIMRAVETIVQEEHPDIVLVQGDTNTVPAVAMAARQQLVPVGHVEAGLRSFNEHSPEEINRKIAAQLALLHFAPTAMNREFLIREGVQKERIFVTGNTVIDALNYCRTQVSRKAPSESGKWARDRPLITVTIHRSTTVDDPARLSGIFQAISELDEFEVIFPVHPRTRKSAERFGLFGLLNRPHIRLIEPLGYIEFLSLLSSSTLLVTDSGGIQEEAAAMGLPVVIAREETARWESVLAGVAWLSGVDTSSIVAAVRGIQSERNILKRLNAAGNLYGDGRAGERIVSIVKEWYTEGRLKYPTPIMGVPRLVHECFRRGEL